jgi:hypothetical protein
MSEEQKEPVTSGRRTLINILLFMGGTIVLLIILKLVLKM